MTALLEAPAGSAAPNRRLPAPWSKRTVWTVRAIGAAALVSIAATVWLGLWVTPPDKVQGNLVRLVYVHPPIAWVALYLSFGTAFVASLLWLWKRTRSPYWDRLAGAAMEVSVVFTALTLLTGSIWGRPTWGVWWAWDARLTSTAMLLVMELGYLAIRRVQGDLHVRATLCRSGADHCGGRAHRALLGRLVAHPAPGGHRAQCQPVADDPRVDGLDTAARVRGLHARFRLDARRPYADRNPVRRARGCFARDRARRAVGRRLERDSGRCRPGRPGTHVRYIDAGYAAALGTLFAYGMSLVVRRRRLGRLAARVPEQSTEENR